MPCTPAIWPAISSVALAVCTASDFTSEATTAKPRPASPARAASMVALSASRLVCPATSWISLTTSPIFCAAFASEWISVFVIVASFTATLTRSLVWASWRLISPIEEDNSSAAEAAVSTLTEASFELSTAPSARSEVRCEAANSVEAVVRMVTALSPTVLSMVSARCRNAAMALSTVARRSSCATSRSRSCSCRR